VAVAGRVARSHTHGLALQEWEEWTYWATGQPNKAFEGGLFRLGYRQNVPSNYQIDHCGGSETDSDPTLATCRGGGQAACFAVVGGARVGRGWLSGRGLTLVPADEQRCPL
jgi:hypothetical protein